MITGYRFSFVNSTVQTEKEEYTVPDQQFITGGSNDELHSLFKLDEDFGLVLIGPVQFLECMCDEFEHNRVFRLHKIASTLNYLVTGLLVSTTIFIGLSLVMIPIAIYYFNELWGFNLVLRSISLISIGILGKYIKRVYTSPTYSWWVLVLFLLLILVISMSAQLHSEITIYVAILEMVYIVVIINHLSGLLFGFIIILSVASCLAWTVNIYSSELSVEIIVQTSLFLYCFASINCYASYINEKHSRETYNLQLRADSSIQKTEKLLKHMLPEHVLQNLQQGITETDKHAEVTILYADISGFTQWSSDKHPIEVIEMLSNLFTRFDKLCVKHHVYKVHTIGDCYVVLGFTDKKKRDPSEECLNVVKMAMDMIKCIQNLNWRKGTEFNMRIGVHTGTIIAGIIGTSIVRYDIYGPDNDIANKMESEGCPGKINISEDTMKILIDNQLGNFRFQRNKPVVYEPTSRVLESYLVFNSNVSY